MLEKLATAAWYLHSNRDGKLFFRNVENLNAKLESLAKAYVREQSLKELRQRLTDLFKPVNGWCYQEVLPLPAIDEINIAADKATLVISEPYMGQGLNPQLKQFFDQTTFKNRVAFLTGSRDTFDSLIESAKRLKAGEDFEAAMTAGRELIASAGFLLDYFEARHAETLAPIQSVKDGPVRILVAAKLGTTRLIDNIGV